MRTSSWLAALVGVLPAVGLGAAACGSSDDCAELGTCDPYDGPTSSSGAGGSTSSSSSTGEGGAGGTPAACVPSDNPAAVSDDCGVFVSSSLGDDANPGTKDAPLKTLQSAIESAGSKPIYACAETFTGALEITSAVTVYGAVDCNSGWFYVGPSTKTILTAPADAIPLTLSAGSEGSLIVDFRVQAVDATTEGGSSIAVLATDNAGADLVDCELEAGLGAKGPDGAAQAQMAAGDNGIDGAPGCANGAGAIGGAGGQLTCGGTPVHGGLGGSGTALMTGGDGDDGLPLGPEGQGGTGQGKPMVASPCAAGTPGAPGGPGMSGSGAMGVGDIDAVGYSAPAAPAGMTSGTPGQGGGGGGGAKVCVGAGPSGGGGGSGGCGGLPGNGGGAAGSSIGLLSHNANVTLTGVGITTAAGGTGGLGGDGQVGGAGGIGGSAGDNNGPGEFACTGGQGGQGGRGGSGGGGLGGHSIGIAFKGNAPPQTDVTLTPGNGGMGGIGGDGDIDASGEAGKACKTLDFGSATCAP